MKTKQIIVAFVIGVSISVAGSMYAAFQLGPNSGVVVPVTTLQGTATIPIAQYIEQHQQFEESIQTTQATEAQGRTLEERVRDLELANIRMQAQLNALANNTER